MFFVLIAEYGHLYYAAEQIRTSWWVTSKCRLQLLNNRLRLT